MSALLARIAIAALIAGTAVVSGAGPGFLTVLFPRGTEVMVHYEDRDGNGYLSLDAPDPRDMDVITVFLSDNDASSFPKR